MPAEAHKLWTLVSGGLKDTPTETGVYRIVQEALTNVARHARASEVHVQVSGDDRRVTLLIEDNGQGAAADASPHMGWLGMRERITALGGQLSIGAGQASGVRIEAAIPIGEPA